MVQPLEHGSAGLAEVSAMRPGRPIGYRLAVAGRPFQRAPLTRSRRDPAGRPAAHRPAGPGVLYDNQEMDNVLAGRSHGDYTRLAPTADPLNRRARL